MREGLHRIWGLTVKELRLLSRDKLLLVFLLLGPLLELTLMGGLTGGGVKNLPLAVVDLDRSRASRELIAKLDICAPDGVGARGRVANEAGEGVPALLDLRGYDRAYLAAAEAEAPVDRVALPAPAEHATVTEEI